MVAEDYSENFWDFISRRGTPFSIDTYIGCSTTATYFTLGGDDETGTAYDLNGDGTAESAPFNRKELWVTSMELYAPNGSASVGKCTFDNIDILGGNLAGGVSLMLAGYGNPGSGATVGAGPTLYQRYGNKPVPIRRRIGILSASGDQIPNAQCHARIKLWGFYLDRKY